MKMNIDKALKDIEILDKKISTKRSELNSLTNQKTKLEASVINSVLKSSDLSIADVVKIVNASTSKSKEQENEEDLVNEDLTQTEQKLTLNDKLEGGII